MQNSPASIGAIDFEITYNQTLVDAPEVDATFANIGNDNPDLNNVAGEAASTCSGVTESGFLNPTGWDCTAAGTTEPVGDTDGNHSDADGTAKLGCFKAGSTLGTGSGPLAYVRFNAIAGGSAALTLANVAIADALANEIGSCNPDASAPMSCSNATITITGSTPIPATATATPTNTATPGPSSTPCPGGTCPNPTLPAARTRTPTPGPSDTPDAGATTPPQPTMPAGGAGPGGGTPTGLVGPDTGSGGGGSSGNTLLVVILSVGAVLVFGGAAGARMLRRRR
jgi:hypothetical protein